VQNEALEGIPPAELTRLARSLETMRDNLIGQHSGRGPAEPGDES